MEVNGLVKLQDFKLSDPILRYQLDPGEPGLLRSAPASQSTAAVSAQERGNLIQFRREALQSGRMVIYSSITFTRGVDGNFPSIRAGLTEVVSVPLPALSKGQEAPEIEGTLSDVAGELNRDSGDASQSEAIIADAEDSVNQQQIELLARLSSLKSDLASSITNTESSRPEFQPNLIDLNIVRSSQPVKEAVDDEFDVPEILDAEPFISELNVAELLAKDELLTHRPVIENSNSSEMIASTERQIQEIKDKLNELEMAKLQARIARMSELMVGTIETNLKILANIIQVANRLGPNSIIPDLSRSVPMLGSRFDFLV